MVFAPLLCVVSVIALPGETQGKELKPADLLRRAEKAYAALGSVRETMVFNMGEASFAVNHTRKGDRFRVEFGAKENRGEYRFDGKKRYQIDHAAKRFREVGEKDLAEGTGDGGFQLFAPKGSWAMTSFLAAVKSPRQTAEGILKGEPAFQVTAKVDVAGAPWDAQMWVAKADGLPLSLELAGGALPVEGAPKGGFGLKVQTERNPPVADDYFALDRAALAGYREIAFEDKPDIERKHRSGVRIVAELDEQLTRALWQDMGMSMQMEPLTRAKFDANAGAVEAALAHYPAKLLKKHLDDVVLVESMQDSGRAFGGTYRDRTLFLVHSDENWIQEAFHHEFSSLLLNAYKDKFPEKEWLALNAETYVSLEKWYEDKEGKGDWSAETAELWEKGFFKRYATTDMENDFNTIVESIFTSPVRLAEAAGKHKRIRGKVELVKRFYRAIDPHFSEAFFAGFQTKALGLWTTDERVPPPVSEVGRNNTALLPQTGPDGEFIYVEAKYASNHGKQPVVILLGETAAAKRLGELSNEWSARGYAVMGMPYSQPALLTKKAIDEAELLFRATTIELPKLPFMADLDSSRIVVVGYGKRAGDAERIVQEELEAAKREERASRVQALVLVEPEGGYGAVKPELFALPMLVVGGNREEEKGFRIDLFPPSFLKSPEGDKFAVWSLGGYTPLAREGGTTADQSLRFASMATVAFFDGFVKKDSKARAFLRNSRLAGLTPGLRTSTYFR